MKDSGVKEQITIEEWSKAKKASGKKSLCFGIALGIVLILTKPMSFIGMWQYLADLIVIAVLFLIAFVYFVYKETSGKRMFEPGGS